jgi:hypothetical protein
VAMEGVGREYYPMIKELGLQISLGSSHGFAKGPFNRANHASVIKSLREGIDVAVQFGCPKVITFTGMREKGISDEEGAKNCVDAWKQVVGYAEEKKVTLCLEHLNSRDSTHPMKGHPGYFGDHVDFCVEPPPAPRGYRAYPHRRRARSGRTRRHTGSELSSSDACPAGDRLQWMRGAGVHPDVARQGALLFVTRRRYAMCESPLTSRLVYLRRAFDR